MRLDCFVEALTLIAMTTFADLQEKEFAKAEKGYTAVRHQREAGTAYFDQVLLSVSGGQASTAALSGSTEEEQFSEPQSMI